MAYLNRMVLLKNKHLHKPSSFIQKTEKNPKMLRFIATNYRRKRIQRIIPKNMFQPIFQHRNPILLTSRIRFGVKRLLQIYTKRLKSYKHNKIPRKRL